MKKTAIQWLFDIYIEQAGLISEEQIQKALQMEREQIEEAHSNGIRFMAEDTIVPNPVSKQYYEQTYG